MADSTPDPVVVTPVEQDDKVLFDWQQPGWEKILEQNELLRRDRGVKSDAVFGRFEFQIPIAVLHFLKKKYPDMASPDMGVKRNAWLKWAKSPASAPYRVQATGRYLARSIGGTRDGWEGRGSDGITGADLSPAPDDGGQTDESLCGGPPGHAGLGDEPAHLGDA